MFKKELSYVDRPSKGWKTLHNRGKLAGQAIRANAGMDEVEKTLHSEYGEIRYVCMKELTFKLWIYETFAGVVNNFVHRFTLSRIYGPVDSHCARTKKFSQSTHVT